MEKIALIELQPTGVKMTIEKLMGGAFHKKIEERSEIIRFDEDVFEHGTITDEKIKACLVAIDDMKQYMQIKGVGKVYAYASSIFNIAQNGKKIVEEIGKRTNIFFTILSNEEEMRLIYNVTIGAIDTTKGVILYVNSHNTYVMNFAKRSLMTCTILPFGANYLASKFKCEEGMKAEKVMAKMQEFIRKEFNRNKIFIEDFEEIKFVGSGPAFLILSQLARKMSHYSFEFANNYYLSKEAIDSAFNLLIDQGFSKTKRLAGISKERLDVIMSGAAIIKVFAEQNDAVEFNICYRGLTEGIIATKIVRENTCEGTPNDLLELSIRNNQYFYPIEDSNSDNVFNLAFELFHQMSIVHKLSRKQLKPLKIATGLYDCGKRISCINYSKFSKDIILSAEILNASHRDLIVAAFACQMQNPENFNLADWIRYKDIVSEDDLVCARKIGGIIALASALDSSKQNKVKELDCDLLGDILIIKAKSDTDATYEINEANKLANMFKRIFNKDFQIM